MDSNFTIQIKFEQDVTCPLSTNRCGLMFFVVSLLLFRKLTPENTFEERLQIEILVGSCLPASSSALGDAGMLPRYADGSTGAPQRSRVVGRGVASPNSPPFLKDPPRQFRILRAGASAS